MTNTKVVTKHGFLLMKVVRELSLKRMDDQGLPHSYFKAIKNIGPAAEDVCRVVSDDDGYWKYRFIKYSAPTATLESLPDTLTLEQVDLFQWDKHTKEAIKLVWNNPKTIVKPPKDAA